MSRISRPFVITENFPLQEIDQELAEINRKITAKEGNRDLLGIRKNQLEGQREFNKKRFYQVPPNNFIGDPKFQDEVDNAKKNLKRNIAILQGKGVQPITLIDFKDSFTTMPLRQSLRRILGSLFTDDMITSVDLSSMSQIEEMAERMKKEVQGLVMFGGSTFDTYKGPGKVFTDEVTTRFVENLIDDRRSQCVKGWGACFGHQSIRGAIDIFLNGRNKDIVTTGQGAVEFGFYPIRFDLELPASHPLYLYSQLSSDIAIALTRSGYARSNDIRGIVKNIAWSGAHGIPSVACSYGESLDNPTALSWQFHTELLTKVTAENLISEWSSFIEDIAQATGKSVEVLLRQFQLDIRDAGDAILTSALNGLSNGLVEQFNS